MKSCKSARETLAALLLASHIMAYAGNPVVEFPSHPLTPRHGLVSALAVPGPLGEPAFLYRSGFDPAHWSGSLEKFKLTPQDDGSLHLSTTPEWDAGELLTGTSAMAPMPEPDQRRIYTSRSGADKALLTIEFRWEQLAAEQQAALDISPATAKPDGLGARRLDYLRGERRLEATQAGGVFRARQRILGDIVNSNPVHAGAPTLFVQGDAYAQFRDDHKTRAATVYVGANDGMLHAFAATDGRELFAYIPSFLLAQLNQLTQPGYAHRSYVDGGLAVAEAQVAGKWKTVLAAAMGAGAQGVVALDVSDPEDFGSGAGVLWEFTEADDADMGNAMGAPAIAKFQVKSGSGIEQKYFVLVASGLNNYRNDGKGLFNKDASGALFLLSLDKPSGEKWQHGVNYYKIKTPSVDAALPNGLHAPTLVGDVHGVVTHAYAGDLQGNLWRFDFSGTALLPKARRSKSPLFVARDANGLRQSISMQPSVAFAPGGHVVLFGTGKFVEEADLLPANFRTQSFYAIYDNGAANYAIDGREQLALRRLDAVAGNAFRVAGDNFTYGVGAHQRKGWYFDFPDSAATGERALTQPVLADGRLYFNSLIPCSEPCASGGGRSYMLNALEGVSIEGYATGNLSQVGLLGAPVRVASLSATGERDATGRRTAKKKGTTFDFGTGGAKGDGARSEQKAANPESPADKSSDEIVVPAGRFSWREILNWQELRDALGN